MDEEIIETEVGECDGLSESEYLEIVAIQLDDAIEVLKDSEFSVSLDEIQKAINKLEGAVLCLRQAAEKIDG